MKVRRDDADLSSVEIWISRNLPANVSMSAHLLQLERMARAAFGGQVSFLYAIVKGELADEVVVETSINGSRVRHATLAMCFNSGRFFKAYGPLVDERVYFKRPADAAGFIRFLVGEHLAQKGERSGGISPIRCPPLQSPHILSSRTPQVR